MGYIHRLLPNDRRLACAEGSTPGPPRPCHGGGSPSRARAWYRCVTKPARGLSDEARCRRGASGGETCSPTIGTRRVPTAPNTHDEPDGCPEKQERDHHHEQKAPQPSRRRRADRSEEHTSE